jgi:hypothetical protein
MTQTLLLSIAFIILMFSSYTGDLLKALSFANFSLQYLLVSPSPNSSALQIAPERLRVSRHGGLIQDGAGSFMQHIKASIILSQILQADLYIKGIPTIAHGYSLGELFRESPSPEPSSASDKNCKINSTRLVEYLPSICAGLIKPNTLLSLFGLEGCNTIYHISEYELYENLNDCVAPFYRQIMQPFITQAIQQYPVTDCVKVGVHMRWGDLASNVSEINANTKLDFRSMSISDINKAWNNIQFIHCKCRHVYVYIKGGPGFAKGTFSFGDFQVIDTGNDLLDLAHYTRNDILIQSKSSYAVLGLFGSMGKKVVITDSPEHPKYNQKFFLRHSIFSPSDKMYYECI